MAETTIPLKKSGMQETLNRLFRDLLEKGVVDALILPQAVHKGKSFAHTLVSKPDMIEKASPFLPVLEVNGARAVANLTGWDPGLTIGAVLRSCEKRAVIELAKFKQIRLENLFLIGVDCLGTHDSVDSGKNPTDGEFKAEDYLSRLLAGEVDSIRQACQLCSHPVPAGVDMNVGFIGFDPGKELFINTSEEVMTKLGLEPTGDHQSRIEAVASFRSAGEKRKAESIAEFKERFKSIEELLAEFARCKRCFNCRQECPICYCKECVFTTNTFDHKPEQYLKWARRKGAIKLPSDTLLFHLTRLNHMAFSCIECGLCSSACPNDLPVYELFQFIGKDVQALFEYTPGMEAEEEPPVLTFKENELEHI